MRMKSILLVSLLVPLFGCQPEAPAPKTAAPAAMEPSPAAPTPSAPAAQPAAPAPAQAMQPAPAEKAMQPAPAPASTATAAKTEPAPIAAEAKPEAKPRLAISEADFMQLAKKSNCLACHSVDKKVVGPAFKDVAAKYRGDAGAEARLADKIAKGGSGVWGAMMMPPSPQVSEVDRRALVKFVLSLK